MSIPTRGEEYAKLMEFLRKAQEAAANISHLEADNDSTYSKGWLGISELLKRIIIQVTKLAVGRYQ